MRGTILLFSLLISFGAVIAQENILWKDHNVIFEENVNEEGNVEYSLYSKEVKYQEMYYLLTVSKGGLQEVMDDILFFENMCNEKKGIIKKRGLNQIVARDSKSVFIIVDSDLGFAELQYNELKKLKKVIINEAADKGVDLMVDNELKSASVEKK